MNIYMEIAAYILFGAVVLAALGTMALLFEDAPVFSFLGAVIVLAASVLTFPVVKTALGADTSVLTLTKSDWTCSRRHTQVSTTYISNGKSGLMPFVTSSEVCDAYVRVGR